MKTRYKIFFIVIASLIAISFFVPEVFLLFYIDKFESNENCDAIGGNWDWINDICNLDAVGTEDADNMCMDNGGLPTCKVHCPRPFGIFNPWQLLGFGCTLPCYPACDFDNLLEKTLKDESYVAFKERFPNSKERYHANSDGFSVSAWEINNKTQNELYLHMEYDEDADRLDANVFCTSGITDEHVSTEMNDELADVFIRTTDCLDDPQTAQ